MSARRTQRAALLAGLVLAALALAAFAAPLRAEPVTLFAAASTADAVDDLAARYAARGGGRVRAVLAASSTLAKQIAQGAPADLFLSADPAWMDYLAARGAIEPDSRRDLLGNRLVLIAPRGGAGAPADGPAAPIIGADFPLADMLAGRPLAIADPDHVPAGRYAKAALESLGLWSALSGRTARAGDVRAALALVDRGEAAAGVVYATDAAIAAHVRIVGVFPRQSHPPIVYPVAIVAGRGRPAVAGFHAYLLSAEAGEVFRAHGFLPAPATAP